MASIRLRVLAGIFAHSADTLIVFEAHCFTSFKKIKNGKDIRSDFQALSYELNGIPRADRYPRAGCPDTICSFPFVDILANHGELINSKTQNIENIFHI